jgi:hypothetical protein
MCKLWDGGIDITDEFYPIKIEEQQETLALAFTGATWK